MIGLAHINIQKVLNDNEILDSEGGAKLVDNVQACRQMLMPAIGSKIGFHGDVKVPNYLASAPFPSDKFMLDRNPDYSSSSDDQSFDNSTELTSFNPSKKEDYKLTPLLKIP
jgi:hypothetical protein